LPSLEMHTPPSQGLPTLLAVHSSDGGSKHTAHARELAMPASSVPSHVPFVHEPPPSQAWPAEAIEHSTGSQNPQGRSVTAPSSASLLQVETTHVPTLPPVHGCPNWAGGHCCAADERAIDIRAMAQTNATLFMKPLQGHIACRERRAARPAKTPAARAPECASL